MKRKLLSLLLAVAMLLVCVPLGAMPEAEAETNTTTLIGFDEADALSKVDLDYMGNGNLSIIDYDGGKALQYAGGTWGYPTITLYNKAQAGATAIALKVKAPVGTGWDVLLHEQDVNGNTTEAYSLKANGTVTLVDASGTATQQTIASAINLFPNGFEGWVVLTTDSLERYVSWGDNGNVLDFASVGKIEMHWETNGANIVDDIIAITDVDAFLATFGGNQGDETEDDEQSGTTPPPAETLNTTTLISFDEADALSKVGLGGMGNGTLSVVDYDGGKALQYAGGTWGYPAITLYSKPQAGTTAIALKVKAPVGTGWNIMLSETDVNGNVTEAYWLKAGGTVTLVDASGTATQQTIANAYNLFPNGFEGWVIVSADSLTKHPGYNFVNNNAIDFNMVGKIEMHWETTGANIVDEIIGITDVDDPLSPICHSWTPATCTSPETCALCGVTRGEVQHTYPMTSGPQVVEVVESPHNYYDYMDESWTVKKEGVTSLTVTFSGDTATESSYDYIYLYDGAGNQIGKYSGTTLAGQTVEVPGDTVRIRLTSDGSNTNYGFHATVSTPEPMVVWTVRTPATCTTVGEKYATCTLCGYELQEEIPPLGHTLKDATCIAPTICTVCGVTEGTHLGHDWQAATCSAPVTCSRCHLTRGTVLPHTWTEATCSAPATCTVCGTTSGARLPHTWMEATCTSPMRCSVCGATSGWELGHSWQSATCTAPATCSRCGLTRGDTIPHNLVADTCTDPSICTECGFETVPLGHFYQDGVCYFCGQVDVDLDGDGQTAESDAIYLLYHTLLPEQYPLPTSGDIDHNGLVDQEDAIRLLYYCLLPEQYPL